jgi:hypothetical protein
MNLFGWGVTGLVLFIILSKAPVKHSPRFAFWVYLANFCIAFGLLHLESLLAGGAAGPLSIAGVVCVHAFGAAV